MREGIAPLHHEGTHDLSQSTETDLEVSESDDGENTPIQRRVASQQFHRDDDDVFLNSESEPEQDSIDLQSQRAEEEDSHAGSDPYEDSHAFIADSDSEVQIEHSELQILRSPRVGNAAFDGLGTANSFVSRTTTVTVERKVSACQKCETGERHAFTTGCRSGYLSMITSRPVSAADLPPPPPPPTRGLPPIPQFESPRPPLGVPGPAPIQTPPMQQRSRWSPIPPAAPRRGGERDAWQPPKEWGRH
jgi:hypothetical protein